MLPFGKTSNRQLKTGNCVLVLGKSYMKYLSSLLLCLLLSYSGSNIPTPTEDKVTAAKLVGKWEYIEAYNYPNWHFYYEFKPNGQVSLLAVD